MAEEIVEIKKEDWKTAQAGEILYWQAKLAKDGEPHKRLRYFNIIKPHIGDTSRMIVADIGAGPKGLLNMLPYRIGIAIDPLMNLYAEAGYDLGVERFSAITGSGENIPLSDNYADRVCSVNALDHAQDATKMFCEMVRVCKPDGLVCIIVDFRLPGKRTPTHQMCLSENFFTEMEQETGVTFIVKQHVQKCSGTAESGFLGVWRKS